ncbi:hypothetical protein [Actinomycetospora soli]|uniref:hypothetical protein n=1 Tax=Actinomycetospora soli TaxID=2893887 RepID=UPI001E57F03F|nr:hypothetical protein [Actinomycetospora soli]MCD2191585.1 hypothetical protein [Actinomycetospora soli]
MEKLRIELENCHGIRKLDATLSFKIAKRDGRRHAVAIYAPNGAMKTSFARTLRDLSRGQDSCDHMFADRDSVRRIVDENGTALDGDEVVVILSYDEELGPTESTSTLLVNADLRREYEELQQGLNDVRAELLAALKENSGTKVDIAEALSYAFMAEKSSFFMALSRIREEVEREDGAPFADLPYDLIFNEKVRSLLNQADLKSLLTDYVTRLNALLDESKYFSRDKFSYFNAKNVTKTLTSNGFFRAGHSVVLHDGEGQTQEIPTEAEFNALIEEEKAQIASDEDLRKRLLAIEAALNKNADVRKFADLLDEHREILPELTNMAVFEQKLWKSYLKQSEPLFLRAVDLYRNSDDRMRAIREQAKAERTEWENVIDIFNSRFYVPFQLTAQNRDAVVLGQDSVPQLHFEFFDGDESASVERGDLLQVLSNGEKKALYILNVLFEMETRKKAGRTTVFVIDDLADSFDYKNKYAIIQYLKEMTEQANFRQIILTHNFDFFRTLQGRGVTGYSTCMMAQKSSERVTIEQATGIQNPFVKDFKPRFFEQPMKRVACIPFMRNILEYTKGEDDPDYITLTSLLHWKSDSASITQGDLDAVFKRVFGGDGAWPEIEQPVIDLIVAQATEALTASQGINFGNKIVLSIATRLAAERYMVSKLDDQALVDAIEAQQTYELFVHFKIAGLGAPEVLSTLDAVVLMTPENIHVNSFMYEPIIDMSDDHLRQLFKDVSALMISD